MPHWIDYVPPVLFCASMTLLALIGIAFSTRWILRKFGYNEGV